MISAVALGSAILTGLRAADPVPAEDDVVAGWLAFGIFIGLAVATGLLLWSFTRQLKRAQKANEAGILPSRGSAPSAGTSTGSTSTGPTSTGSSAPQE